MQWIIQAAISLVLSQLGKISWPAIVTQVIAFVDGFVPVRFQPAANEAVTAAVGVLQAALSDAADIQTIVADVAAGNMVGALVALKALVSKALNPTPMHATVLAALSYSIEEHEKLAA